MGIALAGCVQEAGVPPQFFELHATYEQGDKQVEIILGHDAGGLGPDGVRRPAIKVEIIRASYTEVRWLDAGFQEVLDHRPCIYIREGPCPTARLDWNGYGDMVWGIGLPTRAAGGSLALTNEGEYTSIPVVHDGDAYTIQYSAIDESFEDHVFTFDGHLLPLRAQFSDGSPWQRTSLSVGPALAPTVAWPEPAWSATRDVRPHDGMDEDILGVGHSPQAALDAYLEQSELARGRYDAGCLGFWTLIEAGGAVGDVLDTQGPAVHNRILLITDDGAWVHFFSSQTRTTVLGTELVVTEQDVEERRGTTCAEPSAQPSIGVGAAIAIMDAMELGQGNRSAFLMLGGPIAGVYAPGPSEYILQWTPAWAEGISGTVNYAPTEVRLAATSGAVRWLQGDQARIADILADGSW